VLTVGDVMTRDVLVVPAIAALDEVAAALVLRDVAAAPVRDETGRIAGVISRADLMDGERSAAVRAASDDPGDTPRAGMLMTPAFVVAHAGDPAITAVRLLLGEPAHRVLVFDERDELIGIVTPADLLRALAPPKAEAAGRPARAASTEAPDEPPPLPTPPAFDEPPTKH
jgi:CBS-domain-containing membrane protein